MVLGIPMDRALEMQRPELIGWIDHIIQATKDLYGSEDEDE